MPGAVCDGTRGGEEARVGENLPPRSLGPLVVSPDEPGGHQRFLGVAVRLVTASRRTVARRRNEASMANRTEPEIWVPISLAQAERVVQQIVGGKGSGISLIRVLLALGGRDRVAMVDLLADPEFDDRNLSQNLITSLLVLTAFYATDGQRVADIAIDTGISQTTVLRYLKTWVAVGVLEQDSADRKYRLARRWRQELAKGDPPRSLPTST